MLSDAITETGMASLPAAHLLIFLLISFPEVLPLPALLSINCTPLVQKIHAAPTVGDRQDEYSSFTQCRLDLAPNRCAVCAQNARRAISSLCPNAHAVRAWFDGCYVQYYHQHQSNISSPSHLEAAGFFCGHQATAIDRFQFEQVLETLFLWLRSDINLATRRGFSTGDARYGNGSRLYALAECVRYLSPEECEVCIGKAIEKLYENCGGKEGATVVAGNCAVRYETFRFFSGLDNANGSNSNGESGAVLIRDSEKGGGVGFKVKVAVVWGAGIVCLALFVLSAWLLRRSVINIAKIASLGDGSQDEMGTKVVV